MSLRCLLFSSDEATAAPIRQVLTELDVEAEHCSNPVDAVERVTTQSFQIVITDWKDQPEAAFLLKTARDLKAAARPLTLAIVNEESRAHALQAGANSVLLKPIRPEQVRDTMSTARQLLQSKSQTAAPAATRMTWQSGSPDSVGASAAAAAPAPAFTAPASEKLRAGEFLQSTGPAPGSQFDTESEVRDAMEASYSPVDSLTELEPMAAAVQEAPEPKPEPKEALTGWAALQARLTKSAPAPLKETPAKSDLVSYDDSSSPTQTGAGSEFESFPAQPRRQPDIATVVPREEPAVSQPSGDVEVEDDEEAEITAPRPAPKYGKVFVLGLAFVVVLVAALPQTREKLRGVSRTGARAALRWLNPPPAPMPQTVTQHDSFGQPDDEYKLPAAANIPDSTTDPSKIEVVPVVDPTAKQDKSAAASAGQSQGLAGGNATQPTSGDQPAAPTGQPSSPDQNAATTSAANPQNPPVAAPGNNVVTGAMGNTATSSGATTPANVSSGAPPQTASGPSASPQVASPPPVAATQPPPVDPVQVQVHPGSPAIHNSPTPQVSASQLAGIPSSLKSQVGSTTPEMSGVKRDDSATSSIEPVTLPESGVRALLAQGPDPEYPETAKASGQQGSVVLQVLIGADGTVEDAKFMQGSFVFARAAIDAVKQWRFKPYSINGRAVSVQSTITLNFKPPA